MDKEKNIFEAASNKLGKKKVKKGIKKALPAKRHTPRVEAAKDPEVEEIRSKIRQMQQDITDKLEIINNHSGLKPEQVKNLLSDPKNFTSAQWVEIQNYRKILGDKIFNALGHDIPLPKATSEKIEAQTPAPKETTAASRKGKTLGARKKWIPMR